MGKLSKIGDVEFSATTTEDVTYENEVTDRPVEELGYISDHVKQKPVKFSISGVVTGEDAYSRLKMLRKYCKGKQVYIYYGRNIFANVVIESLSTSHAGNIRNGFSFKIDCKIIKQAVSKQVVIAGEDPASSDESKNKQPVSNQIQKTKSKGKIVSVSKKVDNQKHDKYKVKESKCATEYASFRNPSSSKTKTKEKLNYFNPDNNKSGTTKY